MKLVLAALVLLLLNSAHASIKPDWSRGASVPLNGRSNPYSLPEAEFLSAVRNGRLHSLHYPVTISGILLPYEPMRKTVEADSGNLLRRILQQIFGDISGIDSMDKFENRFGLIQYPESEGEGAYFVPFADGVRPEHRMGFTIQDHGHLGKAITVSCAQCHSGNLFGKKIIGLTNRFPKANDMFVTALKTAPKVPNSIFKATTGATKGEVELFDQTKKSLQYVGAKLPVQLGLDTSLAQVALSLAKREKDEWASLPKKSINRKEPLAEYVADSKPAVWWNVKYKNRWLSDGSIVSGNPVFTNFIWNEVGRGTDLRNLAEWFAENEAVVRELTTAVFSSEAPRYTDFFPPPDLESAKRGQKIFDQTCAKCHGHYEKAWQRSDSHQLTDIEKFQTTLVEYKTKVVDVGTDPQRYVGMRSLVQLNDLEISKMNGVVVEAQNGYVPPPLVGIWARWPYFHNNSAPTLCAVLTPAQARPVKYWAREANDPSEDFDEACNGYPQSKPNGSGNEFEFDTRKPGLRNTGHDEGIFVKDGRSILSADDRSDLIAFLKTL